MSGGIVLRGKCAGEYYCRGQMSVGEMSREKSPRPA